MTICFIANRTLYLLTNIRKVRPSIVDFSAELTHRVMQYRQRIMKCVYWDRFLIKCLYPCGMPLKRKFRDAWLSTDDFKPWLKVDGDLCKASCEMCHSTFTAEIFVIKRFVIIPPYIELPSASTSTSTTADMATRAKIKFVYFLQNIRYFLSFYQHAERFCPRLWLNPKCIFKKA